MADHKIHPLSATTFLTFICLQFLTHRFLIPASGDSPSIYTPIEDIVIDCGNSGNSTAPADPRTWTGDINSKFFPPQLLQNAASVPSKALTQSSTVAAVPYVTARLSRSEFTYVIPVTPGPKFIRLYFYPAPYQNFSRSDAVFSVKAGGYTLLRDFNASVNADASGSDTIFREFCVFVEGNDEHLNVSFIPTHPTTYAFVSGIEIVSMPEYLYHTKPQPDNPSGRGLPVVGQSNRLLSIESYTTLEMVYRINMGGKALSVLEDTGMFRIWSPDNYIYSLNEIALPLNTTINLNFSRIANYSAPEDVYRTATTLGPKAVRSDNLTWKFPVDPQFNYLLRLHFCEIQPEVNDPADRVFLIFIRDMIAEPAADVIQWARGKGSPIYRDYVAFVPSNNSEKKSNLFVTLQANPDDWKTRFSNVILNGIEIFKLNDSSSNLGGQNPDPPPITTPSLPLPPPTHQSKGNRTAIVISAVVGGVVFCIVASFVVVFFVSRRRRRFNEYQTASEGTSWWVPSSFSTTKSSKTRSTTLPSDLCRYFSLAEIKAATKDFDDVFIIGIGGFGHVYKGYIDDGATQVAIKRLKPGSKQGAHEFQTEIELLSQLRHLHLVSLIGYCNDGNEMILVYDYMSRGTLRDHLYGANEPSLSWKQRLQICIGAARGLHYLHTGAKHTIIHRDVKTTNILLDEKWVAKVSDFGLSKVGPTGMSKAHVSTVVKGSFGYLDPEYYRRQQLTEKSDVYSFGVVLCEVLCARPPLIRTTEKDKLSLAEWVRRCNRDNSIAQTVDPNVKDEISPECLEKFVEIAVSCIQDEGMHRPSMNDVVWGLEFASQLQETSKKEFAGAGEGKEGEDGRLLAEGAMFGRSDRKELPEFTSSEVTMTTTTTTTDSSSFSNNKGTSTVFSEINEPRGR